MNLRHRHTWLLVCPAVSCQGGMFLDSREQQKLSLHVPSFLKEHIMLKLKVIIIIVHLDNIISYVKEHGLL